MPVLRNVSPNHPLQREPKLVDQSLNLLFKDISFYRISNSGYYSVIDFSTRISSNVASAPYSLIKSSNSCCQRSLFWSFSDIRCPIVVPYRSSPFPSITPRAFLDASLSKFAWQTSSKLQPKTYKVQLIARQCHPLRVSTLCR